MDKLFLAKVFSFIVIISFFGGVQYAFAESIGTPVVPASGISAILRLGMTNKDVEILQSFLKRFPAIYPEAQITGYFGQLTLNAVKKFQIAIGMEPVGVVGPRTRAQINYQLLAGAAASLGAITDKTAPVITNVGETDITSNSARIVWITDDLSTSEVIYSLQKNLGNSTAVSDATYVTSHSTLLAGLTASTKYYYKVTSKNQFSKISHDAGHSFTTGMAIVKDTVAPVVSIVSPVSGATVSGVLLISASATDNVAVAGVQFKVDGAVLGSEVTAQPYKMNWNSASSTDGQHIILVIARDTSGNYATSSIVTVTASNTPPADTLAPAVSVTAPLSGAIVTGTTTISATASDNIGVMGVQFKLDNVAIGTESTSAPYNINWNSTSVTDGAHSLYAVARDVAGNRATSTAINITVSNSVPPLPPPSTGMSNLQLGYGGGDPRTITGTWPIEGQLMTWYVGARNADYFTTAPPSILRVYYQQGGVGPYLATTDIPLPAISPGQSVLTYWSTTTPAYIPNVPYDQYVFHAVADPDNLISETAENDNGGGSGFMVLPAGSVVTPSTIKPDLVPWGIVGPRDPVTNSIVTTSGKTVFWSIGVKNYNDPSMSATPTQVQVLLYPSGVSTSTLEGAISSAVLNTGYIAPGAVTNVYWVMTTPPVGMYTIVTKIDSNNNVSESNENNNTGNTTFSILQ